MQTYGLTELKMGLQPANYILFYTTRMNTFPGGGTRYVGDCASHGRSAIVRFRYN